MNEQELRQFVADRKPGYSVRHKEAEGLVCYGCAHAAADAPPPGKPSGERPCMSCIRNHEDWRVTEPPAELEIVVDDHGNARCFDARAGFAYNGAPYVHWPPDNYVTMDQSDQSDFYDRNPDYGKPIRFNSSGQPVIVEED